MAWIISEILLILNMLLGAGDHTAKAEEIYRNGDYKVCDHVVIIDGDEIV